ncbi:FkbM family methyltransferase [uncultured Marivirga sp.]|uniref:FkbM family methyltransferase n=1 Tax=uncultured Marivirga sp. TaxID=1123707 RepID=UPI0030EBF143|tara:strand:+ start:31707 stop:32630 length:924 start_codon:yes stop_codon:yes gene_type:complete
MSISNFIYRQKQKIKYHFAITDHERLVAEINRNDRLIEFRENSFKLKEAEFIFPIEYLFLLERYDDLVFLLSQSNGSFQLIGNQLVFKFNNLKLFIKTSEELFIIKEVFYKQIYNINLGSTFNIIDVGMNVGFTSLYFANRDDVQKVYSYEPFKTTFKDAQENFELNKEIEEKIERKNIGLGLDSKVIKVNYSNNLKGKNTTSNVTNLQSESLDCATIELVKASDEINALVSSNRNQLFVIKLDCEGAEFDIFKSFGDQNISEKIVAFMIEWHRNKPQLLIEKLIHNNFKVHCTTDSKEIGFIVAVR